jgi:AraC family transcriptional regulator, ethanolamine operon transcriptional activator
MQFWHSTSTVRAGFSDLRPMDSNEVHRSAPLLGSNSMDIHQQFLSISLREMDRVSPAPEPIFPAGVTAELEVDDFDAIDELSPVWDHEHVQIGRGQPRVKAAISHTARMQVAEIERSPGARIHGRGPPSSFVLAALVESSRQCLQGLPWEPDCLGVVAPGGEFELMAAGPHRMAVVSVVSARLDEECQARWAQTFPRPEASPFLRFRDAAAREALLASCRSWQAVARAHPGLLLDPVSARRMEGEILGVILDGVERHAHLPPVTHRREVVRRADSFLRESLQERISLDDICEAARVSPRGLHAAFESVYGIPPKAYWKVLRLNAVRRELRRAQPGVRVSEVAMRWGFYQLGYFSVYYRELFGESPRDTLRLALESRDSHSPRRAGALS